MEELNPIPHVDPSCWREPDDVDSESYYLEKQGRVVRLSKRVLNDDDSDSSSRSGQRSLIHEFSSQSRANLLRFLSRVDWAAMVRKLGLPLFVTLTYPREFPVSWEDWKRNLEAFTTALRREFPGGCYIWKLEKQRRGAPHYHLVLWADGVSGNSDDERYFKAWLSATWYRIVDSGDRRHLKAGTSVQLVSNENDLVRYMGKYVSKIRDGGYDVTFNYPVGRYWGVINRPGLMSALREVLQLTRAGFMRLRRIIRRWYESRRRQRGQGRYKSSTGKSRKDERWYQGIWAIMPPDLIERLIQSESSEILELDVSCDFVH